jgi:dihydrofolate reductase
MTSDPRASASKRLLRYSVAASLDGFIADPDGGYDWIVPDDEIDFGTYLEKIDALLMGRGTYEVAQAAPESRELLRQMDVHVVSTTLDPAAHPDVTVIRGDVEARVAALKQREGKDIWLYGGGVLFRSLMEAGLVDRVEVGVIPVMLGEGIPLLPGFEGVARLDLHSTESFTSGIVLLKYDVRTS